MKFVIALVIVALTTTQTYAKPTKLGIMGGSYADITAYPYQVIVYYQNTMCGGAIVTKSYVLSAAHCVYPSNTIVYVKAGTSYLGEISQKRRVTDITFPSEYKSDRMYDYDIALLKLQTPFQLNTKTNIIPIISNTEKIPIGSLASIAGWGQIWTGSPFSTRLRSIVIPLIPDKECKRIFPQLYNERVFCAGYNFQGKNVCNGDFGSPLVYNYTIIGIASFGLPCDGITGTIGFTDVSRFSDWISNIINEK